MIDPIISPGIYRVNWMSEIFPGLFTILNVVRSIENVTVLPSEHLTSHIYRCIMHDGRLDEYCLRPKQVIRIDL